MSPESDIRSVIWNGSQFMTVGDQGKLLTSPGGSVWSPQESTISSTLYDVVHAGTEYVAVGAQGRILTSGDGISWSADQQTFTAYNGVAWNGSVLVIVGDDGTVVRRR